MGETRTPGHRVWKGVQGVWVVSPLSSPPHSPPLRVWVSVPRAGPAVGVITSIGPSASAPFGAGGQAGLREMSNFPVACSAN